MSELLSIPFISKNGIRGTLKTASRLLDDSAEKSVMFETGRQAVVASQHLHLKQDGSYYLDLNVDPRPPDIVTKPTTPAKAEFVDVVIPLAEETLVVGKRLKETGRVRVSKTVKEIVHSYDASVVHEQYEVERVPINREVTEITATRMEGDVTVIPVYEEEIITTKRLVLREEIRLIKRRTEEHHPGSMILRKQEVKIERVAAKDDLS